MNIKTTAGSIFLASLLCSTGALGAQAKTHVFNQIFGPSLLCGVVTSDSTMARINMRKTTSVPSRFRVLARVRANAQINAFGLAANLLKFHAEAEARQAVAPNYALTNYSGASYSNTTKTYLFLQVVNNVLRSQVHPTRSSYTSTTFFPALQTDYMIWLGPVPVGLKSSIGSTLSVGVSSNASALSDGNAYTADEVKATVGGQARAYNSGSAWLSFNIPDVIGAGLSAYLKITDATVPIQVGASSSQGLFGTLQLIFAPVSVRVSAWCQYFGNYFYTTVFSWSAPKKTYTFTW